MEPENFDKLQKLLALKRHEQPPPGYFNKFSATVIARIQSAQATRPLTLWERLQAALDFKPALAALAGLTAVGMVLFGLNHAAKVGQQTGSSPAAPSVTRALPIPSEAEAASPQEVTLHLLAGPPLGRGITPAQAVMANAFTSGPPSFLLNYTPTGRTEAVNFRRGD